MTTQNDSSDFPKSMGKIAPRELAINGIKDIPSAARYTESGLLSIHGVGPKAIRILKEELAKRGLKLSSK